MQTIWKYELKVTDEQTVDMPSGAMILSVAAVELGWDSGAIGAVLTVWARVDSEQPMEARTFFVVGTGNQMPKKGTVYLGTVQMPPFVWHVFYEPTFVEMIGKTL
jgi:hypothetical protein